MEGPRPGKWHVSGNRLRSNRRVGRVKIFASGWAGEKVVRIETTPASWSFSLLPAAWEEREEKSRGQMGLLAQRAVSEGWKRESDEAVLVQSVNDGLVGFPFISCSLSGGTQKREGMGVC